METLSIIFLCIIGGLISLFVIAIVGLSICVFCEGVADYIRSYKDLKVMSGVQVVNKWEAMDDMSIKEFQFMRYCPRGHVVGKRYWLRRLMGGYYTVYLGK